MKTFQVNGIIVEVSVSISMYEHWSTLINVLNTIWMYSKILHEECICIFICFIWLHLYWPHVFLTIVFYYSFMLWSITWLLFSIYIHTTLYSNNTQFMKEGCKLISLWFFTLSMTTWDLRRYSNGRGGSITVYVWIK